MNRYSFDTLQLLKDSVREWEREWNERNLSDTSKAGDPTSTPRQIKIYTIEVNFDDIQDDEERKCVESLPTAFKLPPEAVRRVRAVAGKLLNQSEGYRALLRDLEAESKN
jgi:NTE family protein